MKKTILISIIVLLVILGFLALFAWQRVKQKRGLPFFPAQSIPMDQTIEAGNAGE